jgi:hypothetical protein
MTSRTQWAEQNRQYLSTALEWLRARMEEVAPGAEPAKGAKPQKRKPPASAKALKAMLKAEAAETPPALPVLAQRFGLSPFEKNVILLAIAPELDTRITGLCARAQDDPRRSYPTFALAMTLFDEPAWDVLSPSRGLRYWRLLEISSPAYEALVTSPIRADERVANYVKGLNYLDERLSGYVFPMDSAGQEQLPPSHESAVAQMAQMFARIAATRRPQVIQLAGRDPGSKQLLARHVAASLGLQLFRLPVELLPTGAVELDNLIRLWQRESFLLPLLLYVDASAGDGDLTETQKTGIESLLARNAVSLFIDARDPIARIQRQVTVVEVSRPTPAEQEREWQAWLGNHANGLPGRLAGQFNLSLAEIRSIRDRYESAQVDSDEARAEIVWTTSREVTRPRLDALAQRIVPRALWSDLVLPEAETSLLKQITAQVTKRMLVYDGWGFRRKMTRGFGITALFAGESGTGKTLAAEVMANELKLDLYKVDLSGVVSKYIGETEKNLRRLFDAAEDGGAILLFDEADALFGKRSEVKDSHDRYANIEIDYLLQRMEAYRGLAILTTNMKSALDPAFVRRLRFIVQFPFPAAAERRTIWQKAIPPETPIGDLDYDRLARLNLTGGSIHQVALNAAFLAADAGGPLDMRMLLKAARNEFSKMERPIAEGDFTWQEAPRV